MARKRTLSKTSVFAYLAFILFLFPFLVTGQDKLDSLYLDIQRTLPAIQSGTELYLQKIELEKTRAEIELRRIESKLVRRLGKVTKGISLPETPFQSAGSSLLPQAYVPKLDSLITSLKFINSLENTPSASSVMESIQNLEFLQEEFNKLQYFRAEINMRRK